MLTTPPPKIPTEELVIPEGLRLTQIAEKVQKDLEIPAKRFLKEAQSGRYVLPPYLPEGTATPEGFLFPKSYEFVKKGLSARVVARKLLEQFGTEAEALPFDRTKELGVTPYELVIIASMIEEEAGVDRDRRLIAGVIYNRLEMGMALGIDATLLYDDPTPDGELSSSDIATRHPVQHPDQSRSAADADREPRGRIAPGGPRSRGYEVPLLRAVRRGRPPSLRADERGTRPERA